MKYENKTKFLGIILMLTIMLSFVSIPVAAADGDIAGNVGNSLVESLFSSGGGLLTKVFGLSPVVHGILVGAFSAVKTFSNLSKVEIDFALDRDKVNISNDIKDYTMDQENDFVYKNRLDAKATDKNSSSYENILLTDKNVLDAQFIKVKNLIDIDNGSNSPTFRLADKTKLTQVLDSNNEVVDIQKREILFEDPNKTIENEYEYRNFVVKYPKSTYNNDISYSLTPEDIFNGKFLSGDWLAFLASPFSTGKQLIKISRVLSGNDNFLKIINDNRKDETVTEPFKLIFNSYVRDEIDNTDLDQVNCITESGMLLGQTGTEALPKVAYDWDFSYNSNVDTISGMNVNTLNWCDADLTGEANKQSIFCDSTQFSIELLNKLKEINDFVETNSANFTCPTPGVTQSLVSSTNNLGITILNSSYEDRYINVDYRIEGGFNNEDKNLIPETYGDLSLKVYKNNVEVSSKVIPLIINDFNNEVYTGEETFNVGLILDETTNLKVSAVLILRDSYISVDSELDNILENTFTPNSDVCNIPKTSQNLNLYSKNTKIDTSLVEFRSYLMKDGYSDDFKSDFDRYYRFTITAAPTEYVDKYYKYFTSDKFNFQSTMDSEPGRLILQGPGRYNVLLNVEFDDQWRLFDDAGNVTGNVNVVLSREISPERDSPLYYMPFDGLVGIDSDNARQGYGVDYTGDIVTILQTATNQYLRTEPFTQSNTINTVSVKEYGKLPNEFSFLNNGSTRGMLLNINLSNNKTNPELYFVPSRATPVALKVSNQANDAYSFYKLDIGAPQELGGEPALTSGTLVPWTGIGNCLDFSGISVQEAFLDRPDIQALSSKLAPITPSQSVAYGVEWDAKNITRRGDVYLRTVFYTPSNFKTGNGTSVLYLDASDDSAMFYTKETNGSNTVELNNILGNDIKYVVDIFNLVKEKNACIDYSGNSLKVYYNPIAVTSPLFGGDLSSDSQNTWVESKGACIVN